VHIPNGFDLERFSAIPRTTPAALAGLPRPLLGFIGTLFGFLDFEVFEGVARIHHDKSLVLVGPIEANAREAVERLIRLPNVFHLGPQPQSDIPAYVSAFDVCLSPFREGRVADSVSPLKVYEYLAMGRPVVSSPMKSLQLEPAGEVVAFASGVSEFCAQIERSLSDTVQRQVDQRRAAVDGYSWERLFERLDVAVADALS
jgi:glycosyltransferase involved in cell wall biosynthesis